MGDSSNSAYRYMANYTKLHALELSRSYSSMRCRTYAEYFWFKKKITQSGQRVTF